MDNDVSKTLSARIRGLLKALGRSQAWLAGEMDIKPGYLSELLSGHPDKRWNIDHIQNLVEVLNVPAWHLFIDPDEIYIQEDQQIVAAYRALSEGRRESVELLLFGEKKNTSLIDDKLSPPEKVEKITINKGEYFNE